MASGATGLARILQIADKRGGDVVAQTPSGKKKRTGTKLLIGLLLVVPAVYVIVQVATIAARSSALLTQTAVQGTMAESVVCEGFLGMTEQIIT